jgi:hypothetical protein
MKTQKTAAKLGIGLYTYEQAKNTTPFQYFAQIVVGAAVVLTGAIVVYALLQSRTAHTWGLVASSILILMGIFMAHAGLIFWYRRLRKR